MTYKNAKTVLFASLIAAMIPFLAMDFADAETENKLTQMAKIYDEFNIANNNEKQTLISEYIEINKEYNTDNYKTPDRNFIDEWTVFHVQSVELIEKRHIANEELKYIENSDKINAKQSEINSIDSQIIDNLENIKNLENESIISMKMDNDKESQLKQIVSDLHTIYGNQNNNNAFDMAGINYEQKKLLVELTTQFDDSVDSDLTSISLAENIRNEIGNDDVIIRFDSFIPVTCTDYLDTCTPDRVGGVALYRADDASSIAGSIGYKATYNGDIGYITAGHSVNNGTGSNMAMKQITTQISNGFGYPFTTSTLAGDYSFQKTSSSIIDDIYFSTNTIVDIEDHAIAADHVAGTFMYKMGAGLGLTWGTIQNSYGAGTWEISAGTASGDSGGPTFQIIGFENGQYTVKVFGHVTNADTSHTPWQAVYQPVDKIVSAGMVPSVD